MRRASERVPANPMQNGILGAVPLVSSVVDHAVHGTALLSNGLRRARRCARLKQKQSGRAISSLR